MRMEGENKPYKRASCVGCMYHRRIGEPGNWACHYMLDTGEARGCPPEDCVHKTHVPSKRYRNMMMMRAVQYFSDCRGKIAHDADGNPIRGKDGKLCMEGERPPTVIGLALAMGFHSRKQLFAMREDEQVGDVVRWALGKCEAYLEEKLYETAAGIKLALQSNFPDWSEEQKEEEESKTVVRVKVE